MSLHARTRAFVALLLALFLPALIEAQDLRHSRVALATGVTLEVVESGPAAGEPVLFLHGFPDSWFSFSPVARQLPAHVRAIMPSQRGHGESDKPASGYSPAELARDAVALLDALEIPRATIVGHSMGSFVAQRVALDHPARVTRLVLIGSSLVAGTAPVREVQVIARDLRDPVDSAFIHDFQVSTAATPMAPSLVTRLVAESRKIPVHVWHGVMDGLMQVDVSAELGRIAAPTLVVWGEKDVLFGRAEQERLLRTLPEARFVEYPGLGHSPNWEDPGSIGAVLAAWFKTTPVRAPRASARGAKRR